MDYYETYPSIAFSSIQHIHLWKVFPYNTVGKPWQKLMYHGTDIYSKYCSVLIQYKGLFYNVIQFYVSSVQSIVTLEADWMVKGHEHLIIYVYNESTRHKSQ